MFEWLVGSLWACWVGFVVWQRDAHEKKKAAEAERKEKRENRRAIRDEELHRLRKKIMQRQLANPQKSVPAPMSAGAQTSPSSVSDSLLAPRVLFH